MDMSFLLGDKNVLALDRGGGTAPVNVLNATECTF